MAGERKVAVEVAVNDNIKRIVRENLAETVDGIGAIPTAVKSNIIPQEKGDGVTHQTVLTVSALAQAVINATEYQGDAIYVFPEGRILILGCTMSIGQTTTSAIAGTINSGSTGVIGLGSATASATTLATTMVDMMPSTEFVSSATINVQGTVVGAPLAASAQIDGTSTQVSMYFNSAYATTGDVDADGTQEFNGTITVTWQNLGDY